jgi:hypothetical protein
MAQAYLGSTELNKQYLGSTQINDVKFVPFTPASLSNVLYWFTSDKGVTTSGGDITAWQDQISGSISLELTSSINAPKYNISDPAANNEPSIEFNTGVTKCQGLYKYLASS